MNRRWFFGEGLFQESCSRKWKDGAPNAYTWGTDVSAHEQ